MPTNLKEHFKELDKVIKRNIQLKEILEKNEKWNQYVFEKKQYDIKHIDFILSCDKIEYIPSYNKEEASYYLIYASTIVNNEPYIIIQEKIAELFMINSLPQLFDIVDIKIDKILELIDKCPILSTHLKQINFNSINSKEHEIKLQFIAFCY